MPGAATLAVFALVTLALAATPGPSVLYLLGRVVGEGRRAGFITMLGIETGELAYVVLAGVGLSAVIARSALALTGLRLAGAGYLIVIGVRCWRKGPGDYPEQAPWRPRHAFAQGFVVHMLNPKVAVFFLAYFPQFLRPHHPVAPQV